MKLGYHKGTKLMEPDFSGKFEFGQKWLKNEVLGIFLKIDLLVGPRRSRIGPMVLPPSVSQSVSQSVSLSVRNTVFSKLAHLFFLIFLHEVRGP